MTQFEQAQQQVKDGTLQTPSVSMANGKIDYFGYQLAVHKYNLSLMTKGIMSRGVKLGDLKRYYGLKGRTAVDVLPQFMLIFNEYKSKFN